MRFWDSSAVVPLIVDEASTRMVVSLYRKDPRMLVWWAAEVECVSAISRLEREGRISTLDGSRSLHRLEELRREWQEIPPTDLSRDIAIRYLRVHSLRAADALQLAAGFVASEQHPPTLEFVCLDERLAEAARREGFPLPLLPGS